MPRISVIVPMYNVEDFIGECIESLRAQSFKDFEVVCVDDGSTDDTAQRAADCPRHAIRASMSRPAIT